MSIDLPNFDPDLGDTFPLTDGPKRGIRVQAERSFIQMVQAAFLGNDDFPYHPDEEKGRLYVRSAVSTENQAFLPRVEVKIGPLSEYDGSIDNLNKWSKPVQRHLYVDQAQVVFICTAEEEAEANDLGERVRRVLDLARKDLGQRGLFAMQRSELTAPKPARPGTENDDVYQSVVKAPFMMIERQERRENPTAPEGTGAGGTYEYVQSGSEGNQDGREFSGEDYGDNLSDSDASVESVVAKGSAMGTKIIVTFDKRMRTHQVSGMTATLGPDDLSPYTVRNNQELSELCLEVQESVPAGTPVTVSYSPGNLLDYGGHPVPAFGPINGSWA